MIKGLIALAFGALGFGVAEFVAMGLLPFVARDFSVDVAVSGHTITVYAIGVCFGVIYMMFTRKLNLKTSILIVVSFQLVGMLLTAFAPSFEWLLVGRFISGMPHGCFFGLATIIATRIADVGKSSTAMAIMIAGQTISNVFGVPLGTALAYAWSWRAIFYIMIVWCVLVIISLWQWLPNPGKLEDHGFMKQFEFLKRRSPYLIGLSILVGNGGIFCIQTYVSPILTDFVGVKLALVSSILIAMGIAMTIANLVVGRMCDRFRAGWMSTNIFILTMVMMLVTFFYGHYTYFGICTMTFIAGMLFGLSTPQQVSILRVSKGGELIGVAFGQIAFNFGNAIGATLGGVPLNLGLNAKYVLLVAFVLTLIGTTATIIYAKFYEPKLIAKEREAAALKKAADLEKAKAQSTSEAPASSPADAVAEANAASTGAAASAGAAAFADEAAPASASEQAKAHT